MINPMILCDFYKISHRNQYPEGTTEIYSTLTPRTNKYFPVANGVVSFGFQHFAKHYLKNYFDDNFFSRPIEDIIEEYKEIVGEQFSNADTSHIEALHKLGYLPVEVMAVPEGLVVDIGTPVMTIRNTHPDFYWLTNYLETLISCTTWQPMTSATIAGMYRLLGEKYANETVGKTDFVDYQFHDFSMRGMGSLETAILSGMGHLVFFNGTDTIPAIQQMDTSYYERVGSSIPATEHSVMSSYGTDEYETFRHLIEDVYPSGLVAIVSDTYDFWGNVTDTLPRLKDKIMQRDGKVVIRPDSGDPVLIVCGDPQGETEAERKGLVECLWDIFGGTVNAKGYKELDPHIGVIYGDSITLERAEQILARLKAAGFASNNVVFGVGSYTYQYNTRDTLGFAVKATSAVINGEEKLIFKDPKTDKSKMKKSQRGRVSVELLDGRLTHRDGLDRYEVDNVYNVMEPIFRNGEVLCLSTLSTVRHRAKEWLENLQK